MSKITSSKTGPKQLDFILREVATSNSAPTRITAFLTHAHSPIGSFSFIRNWPPTKKIKKKVVFIWFLQECIQKWYISISTHVVYHSKLSLLKPMAFILFIFPVPNWHIVQWGVYATETKITFRWVVTDPIHITDFSEADHIGKTYNQVSLTNLVPLWVKDNFVKSIIPNTIYCNQYSRTSGKLAPELKCLGIFQNLKSNPENLIQNKDWTNKKHGQKRKNEEK